MKPGRSISAPVLDSLLQGKPLGVLRLVNRRLTAQHLGREERRRRAGQGNPQRFGSAWSITRTSRWQAGNRSRATRSGTTAHRGFATARRSRTLLLLLALPVLAAQTITALVIDEADVTLVFAIRLHILVLALAITAD